MDSYRAWDLPKSADSQPREWVFLGDVEADTLADAKAKLCTYKPRKHRKFEVHPITHIGQGR